MCSSILLCRSRWCIGIFIAILIRLWCHRIGRFRRWFSRSKEIYKSVHVSNSESSEQTKSTHAANNLMKIVALIVCEVGTVAGAKKHHAGYPPYDRLSLDPLPRRVFRDCFVQSECDGEYHRGHDCSNGNRRNAIDHRYRWIGHHGVSRRTTAVTGRRRYTIHCKSDRLRRSG
jgi:hypothetical protein